MSIYTEEEAKTKVCWKGIGHSQSHNFQHPYCIGSACMAWRWANNENEERWSDYGADIQEGLEGAKKPESLGLCGLAGKATP
jgi:hypothetical protein